ncbi:MAG: hypothetical protein K0S07_29 [Chlamydiales bacterium]|jgi:hypothetical protein|nr:hypothetical protein [Chlamydiales bacterium]
MNGSSGLNSILGVASFAEVTSLPKGTALQARANGLLEKLVYSLIEQGAPLIQEEAQKVYAFCLPIMKKGTPLYIEYAQPLLEQSDKGKQIDEVITTMASPIQVLAYSKKALLAMEEGAWKVVMKGEQMAFDAVKAAANAILQQISDKFHPLVAVVAQGLTQVNLRGSAEQGKLLLSDAVKVYNTTDKIQTIAQTLVDLVAQNQALFDAQSPKQSSALIAYGKQVLEEGTSEILQKLKAEKVGQVLTKLESIVQQGKEVNIDTLTTLTQKEATNLVAFAVEVVKNLKAQKASQTESTSSSSSSSQKTAQAPAQAPAIASLTASE